MTEPEIDCEWGISTTKSCEQKKRQWWIVISVLLAVIIVLWILVIFYLLSPNSQTMMNKQLYVATPNGESHLLILQPKAQRKNRFLAKQEYVQIYDLESRQWKSQDSISLLPSFKNAETFYFLHYCPQQKHFSQMDYHHSQIQPTEHRYSAWSYFLNEMGVYLGLYPKSCYHHHVLRAI